MVDYLFWQHWAFWQQVLANFWGGLAAAIVFSLAAYLAATIIGWLQRKRSRAESRADEERERREGSKPVVILDYELKGAYKNPQERRQQIHLKNVSTTPVFDIKVDPIEVQGLRATFEPVSSLLPGETKPVTHLVRGTGPAFVGDLVSVLEEAHANRRPHSLSGLFQVISIPVSVQYTDTDHHSYRSLHEIRFTGFYRGATATFLKVESLKASDGAPV